MMQHVHIAREFYLKKIDHKPIYTHSVQQENKQSSQSTNTYKISQKEKLKKLFSKFAFGKLLLSTKKAAMFILFITTRQINLRKSAWLLQ